MANGDEGDPGSFADRLLMERDPHRVLEGLALAGLACGASRGFAYVRSEYPRARAALAAAVEEARAAGHLGVDVHGSGVDFDVEVVRGAGSYVAGEETALIAALEGVRGGAQVRPPYPAQDGFERAPTSVNNVETLCAVPWIVARGGAAFARRGTPDSPGTKLVCLNERFRRPGVYEVALGVTVASICDDLGGGLRDGRRLRALGVGGPLGGFLGPDELDTPLSTEGLRARRVQLGHGGLVALDEGRSAHEIHEHMWGFIAGESCGNCAPCRVGSMRGLETARRISRAGGDPGAPATLRRVLDILGSASLCGLGLGFAPSRGEPRAGLRRRAGPRRGPLRPGRAMTGPGDGGPPLRLRIDGDPVEVAHGATVLDAVRAAGRDVPTLCHDPRVAAGRRAAASAWSRWTGRPGRSHRARPRPPRGWTCARTTPPRRPLRAACSSCWSPSCRRGR